MRTIPQADVAKCGFRPELRESWASFTTQPSRVTCPDCRERSRQMAKKGTLMPGQHRPTNAPKGTP